MMSEEKRNISDYTLAKLIYELSAENFINVGLTNGYRLLDFKDLKEQEQKMWFETVEKIRQALLTSYTISGGGGLGDSHSAKGGNCENIIYGDGGVQSITITGKITL